MIGSIVMEGLLPPAAAAAPGPMPRPPAGLDWRFRIDRKGKPIGNQRYVVTLGADGREMTVSVTASMAVKVAFVTAFRYEQNAEEVWRDGLLQSLDSVTNDDGQEARVTARRVDDRIELTGPGGPFVAAGDLLTTNSVWHPVFVTRRNVIDPSDGTVVGLVIHDRGIETVDDGGGRGQEAKRYDFITPYLAGRLWYGADDRLVGALVERKGEVLRYVAEA
jgi:hypothetical protein